MLSQNDIKHFRDYAKQTVIDLDDALKMYKIGEIDQDIMSKEIKILANYVIGLAKHAETLEDRNATMLKLLQEKGEEIKKLKGESL
jgi:hypothetical protein